MKSNKLSYRKRCRLSLLLMLASFSQSLYGKDPQNKSEVTQCRISIIAIGPRPPRRFGKDESGAITGASTLLPPRKGELPPKKLFISKSTEQNQVKSIDVNYNATSRFITIPAYKTLKLRQKNENREDYLTIKPSESGSINLILLEPSSPSPQRWSSTPKQLKINLTSYEFKEKQVVFINLSKRPIKSKYSDKEVILQPDQRYLHASQASKGLHHVSAYYSIQDKTILNSAMKLDESSMILFIFYNANPHTNDGRTVGLARVRVNLEQEQKMLLKKHPE